MTTRSMAPSRTASGSGLRKVRLACVLTACATSFALSHGATAADLTPVLKAPPPVAAFSWTGFYAGGNVGYSFGNARNDFNAFNPSPDIPVTCPPTGASLCAAGGDSNSMNGAIGGFQAGYNRQFGRYVAGIETDIQISGQKGRDSFTLATGLAAPPDPAAVASVSNSESLDWLGTLRGRLGVASDRWLVYGTGGLAYGHVNLNGSAAATGIPFPGGPGIATCVTGSGCPFQPLAAWGSSQTRVGWTAGFGVERVLGTNDRWSVKVEYLYVDLGRVSTSFATSALCAGNGTPASASCFTVLAGAGTMSTHVTDNIVRIGGNYRF